MQGLNEHKNLQLAVRRAIADGGFVRDDASDELSRARGKIKTIENRLRNLLKGMNGEMSEQVSNFAIQRTWRLPDYVQIMFFSS